MCRNIHTLHNFDPPATDDEVRAAALQYVRKVSGSTKPSRANAEPFDQAAPVAVLAATADEEIVPGAAVEQVLASVAVELVVPVAAEQPVVAALQPGGGHPPRLLGAACVAEQGVVPPRPKMRSAPARPQ